MKKYVEKFKALSDETRIRILYLLLKSDSELCVCELTDSLDIPQYNVSRHLKILRNAGLIEERKEGRWVYFSRIKENKQETEALLNSISNIPESLFSKELKELDKRFGIRTNGKCLIGIKKKHLMGNHFKNNQEN